MKDKKDYFGLFGIALTIAAIMWAMLEIAKHHTTFNY